MSDFASAPEEISLPQSISAAMPQPPEFDGGEPDVETLSVLAQDERHRRRVARAAARAVPPAGVAGNTTVAGTASAPRRRRKLLPAAPRDVVEAQIASFLEKRGDQRPEMGIDDAVRFLRSRDYTVFRAADASKTMYRVDGNVLEADEVIVKAQGLKADLDRDRPRRLASPFGTVARA